MNAIQKILERFDAVELPSGHYQIAFVTPEEFKAAIAEAWDECRLAHEQYENEAMWGGWGEWPKAPTNPYKEEK